MLRFFFNLQTLSHTVSVFIFCRKSLSVSHSEAQPQSYNKCHYSVNVKIPNAQKHGLTLQPVYVSRHSQ